MENMNLHKCFSYLVAGSPGKWMVALQKMQQSEVGRSSTTGVLVFGAIFLLETGDIDNKRRCDLEIKKET
jgi:hypothetical protein